MVGYNRRFSPLAVKMKSLIPQDTAIMANYLVNTGKIPENHWTLDPVEGGGRLLGEADHFFDMFCYLSGSTPKTVFAQCILDRGMTIKTQYNFCVQVRFENGSICSLTYTGRGSSLYPKETMNVCAAGQVMIMSDYKTLEVTGAKTKKFKGADKGHPAEMVEFEKILRGTAKWELPYAPLCALGALRSLETGKPVDIEALKDEK
jgi:predicted dehydrogenase